MAFYDGDGVLVDKGSETKVIYLDLHKAFGAATHDILVSESGRHGFARWTLLRRNWLDGYSQRVAVTAQCSSGDQW